MLRSLCGPYPKVASDSLVCNVNEHKLMLSTADDLHSNHGCHDQYTDGDQVRLEELP